eukprot:CAMPEP_0116852084 /NCGR_PEP_ID=MMETSP0418-20121206/17096_1 /TAXON_ID=1158023 /ORGANISM="Astrosyne radiata, Strain 13vi08-1A" /LENGTH=143 /DNA_ID=CAMNT_0004484207 /DNA_START=198 /DNA_END=626 /DNA_ORIENTATION=-
MMDGEEFIFRSLADREFVSKLLEDLRKSLVASGPLGIPHPEPTAPLSRSVSASTVDDIAKAEENAPKEQKDKGALEGFVASDDHLLMPPPPPPPRGRARSDPLVQMDESIEEDIHDDSTSRRRIASEISSATSSEDLVVLEAW